jgi:hypothetical protein
MGREEVKNKKRRSKKQKEKKTPAAFLPLPCHRSRFLCFNSFWPISQGG